MRRRSIGICLLVVLLLLSSVNTVTAATYKASGERGIKFLAWSESVLLWSTNSANRVTASDAYQDHSGLFVRNKGTQKLSSLSSTTQHAYNYKNEFLAGAVIGGVTLGFSRTITDRIIGKGNGTATFQWDV